MVVNYFGNGCFRLQSGETSILVDPENDRLKADIVLRTTTETSDEALAEISNVSIISFPGEYEVKGIEVLGFPIKNESTEESLKTAYVVRWEEMKLVFLGHLAQPIDAVLMEECSDADLLILPIGGSKVLEPEVAAKIAKQLEARIILPSFYKSADEFLKALGKKAEVLDKFVFKQKDIVGEKGRAIILKQN